MSDPIRYVTVSHPRLKCKCGSSHYIFRCLSEWDTGTIEKSTLIHVSCLCCNKKHGLLGEPATSWKFSDLNPLVPTNYWIETGRMAKPNTMTITITKELNGVYECEQHACKEQATLYVHCEEYDLDVYTCLDHFSAALGSLGSLGALGAVGLGNSTVGLGNSMKDWKTAKRYASALFQ